jgi:hypothetical protein
MAVASPLIEADAIEATEFPKLSDEHGVSGVPQTTINFGKANILGAVPESSLIAEVRKVIGK